MSGQLDWSWTLKAFGSVCLSVCNVKMINLEEILLILVERWIYKLIYQLGCARFDQLSQTGTMLLLLFFYY